MRIDKMLSELGFGSRNDIRKMMKQGIVTVNDAAVKDPAHKVDEALDVITVAGEEVLYEKFIYLMLNKPKGYICATEGNEQIVLDLIDEGRKGLFPAGRLDKDTTGFVLITNDGQLAHNLLAPKKHVDKEYLVTLENEPAADTCERFREGIVLEDGTECQPGICTITGPRECRLVIHEGKFHQVKRMFEALGNRVVDLHRLRIGDVVLDPSLPLGAYRELTASEVESLKNRSRE